MMNANKVKKDWFSKKLQNYTKEISQVQFNISINIKEYAVSRFRQSYLGTYNRFDDES